jgi:ATP-dependent Lon protease
MLTILGVVRIRVDNYVLERPYLEAEVTVFPEPSVPKDDQELQELAISLKSTGRELLALLQNLKLPTPFLTQLQKFIENASAGALADLLISTIESSYEEKLVNHLMSL